MLRKGVDPYEYMGSWEKFDETTLPTKEVFHSYLNLEDISDEGYVRPQKVWGVFEIKNLGEYHDVYVNSYMWYIIACRCGSKIFGNKCLEIYELDPIHFVSPPGLAWQAYLKKTGVKLESIADYDMLLMIEKEIRGGICQAAHRYTEANNKYMKSFDKNNEPSYIEYLDANNLYRWAMSQKLFVKSFKWVKEKRVSKFNENFIKKYDEDCNKGSLLEVDVEYPKELFNFHKDLSFLPERKKVEKVWKTHL